MNAIREDLSDIFSRYFRSNDEIESVEIEIIDKADFARELKRLRDN